MEGGVGRSTASPWTEDGVLLERVWGRAKWRPCMPLTTAVQPGAFQAGSSSSGAGTAGGGSSSSSGGQVGAGGGSKWWVGVGRVCSALQKSGVRWKRRGAPPALAAGGGGGGGGEAEEAASAAGAAASVPAPVAPGGSPYSLLCFSPYPPQATARRMRALLETRMRERGVRMSEGESRCGEEGMCEGYRIGSCGAGRLPTHLSDARLSGGATDSSSSCMYPDQSSPSPRSLVVSASSPVLVGMQHQFSSKNPQQQQQQQNYHAVSSVTCHDADTAMMSAGECSADVALSLGLALGPAALQFPAGQTAVKAAAAAAEGMLGQEGGLYAYRGGGGGGAGAGSGGGGSQSIEAVDSQKSRRPRLNGASLEHELEVLAEQQKQFELRAAQMEAARKQQVLEMRVLQQHHQQVLNADKRAHASHPSQPQQQQHYIGNGPVLRESDLSLSIGPAGKTVAGWDKRMLDHQLASAAAHTRAGFIGGLAAAGHGARSEPSLVDASRLALGPECGVRFEIQMFQDKGGECQLDFRLRSGSAEAFFDLCDAFWRHLTEAGGL